MSSAPPKADKAREALEWCRYGHQKMMIGDPTGQDWVLIWAGTIALLRAVGHALVNEDAKSDVRLKEAQSAWWSGLNATKPNPLIFWKFIDHDRNQLLKQAELTAGQSTQLFLQGGTIARHVSPPPPPPPPIHTYQMNSGYFVGQDPRKLVRDAIEWWEQQLNDIEQKAAAG
jgi:hypothetical protein